MPNSARKARRSTAVAFLVHGSITGTWAARVADVQSDIGMSERTLGFALFGLAAGAVTALPVAGGLAARRGPRWTTGAGWGTLVVGLAAAGAAGSPVQLGVLLAIFGVGLSVMDVGMNAHAAAVERRLGRPVMIGFHARWSIGGVVGALAAAGAIALGLSPLPHFALAAILGSGALSLVFAQMDPPASGPPATAPRFAFPTRALAGLSVMAAVAALGEGAATDWASVHLRRVFSVDGSGSAAGYLLFAAGMTGARLLGDRLVEQRGHRPVIVGCALVSAAGFVLAAAAPVAAVATGGFGVAGIGLGALVPLAFSTAERVEGVVPGQGVAGVATVAYASFVAGPPVLGVVAEAASLRWSFLLVAVCLLAVAARPPSPVALSH